MAEVCSCEGQLEARWTDRAAVTVRNASVRLMVTSTPKLEIGLEQRHVLSLMPAAEVERDALYQVSAPSLAIGGEDFRQCVEVPQPGSMLVKTSSSESEGEQDGRTGAARAFIGLWCLQPTRYIETKSLRSEDPIIH